MIQSQHSLPLAPHLMAAPSNFGNFSREEVEKDSRHGPMWVVPMQLDITIKYCIIILNVC